MLFRSYQFSYRDPHIVETLAAFAGLREYIAAKNWSQTDIGRAMGIAPSPLGTLTFGHATAMRMAGWDGLAAKVVEKLSAGAAKTAPRIVIE